MTCIAGIVRSGVVYLAGDSAAVSGYQLKTRRDEKVFVSGQYVVGYTTSFRMGQVLRYSFTPPKPLGDDLHGFLCTEFVDRLRSTFKNAGCSGTSDGREDCGEFLVGIWGRLFKVCSDYQVEESRDAYNACGCGADLALGALSALDGTALAPESQLEAALRAAERFSSGVRGPFVGVRTPAVDSRPSYR